MPNIHDLDMMSQPISGKEQRAERLAGRMVDKYGAAASMEIACARFARSKNSRAVLGLWLAVVRHVGQLLRERGEFSLEGLGAAVGPIPEFGEGAARGLKPNA